MGGWRPSRLTFNRRTEGSSPQRGLGRSSVLAVAATTPLRWLKQDLDELAEVATGRSAWWRRSSTKGLSQPVPAAWGQECDKKIDGLECKRWVFTLGMASKQGIPGRCSAGPESSVRSGRCATLSLRQSKEAPRQIPPQPGNRLAANGRVGWDHLVEPSASGDLAQDRS